MSRPPRICDFPYTGLYRYFLTCCTRNRRVVFVEQQVVWATLLKFRESAQLESTAILAYCFMPDHLHLLTEGTDEASDFRRFVKRAKQHSGAAYSLRSGTRLWQEGYFDRVLRDSENTEEVVRYILANPVRAGIVKSPEEYPFLGSDRFTLGELFDHCQDAGSKRTRPTS